MLRRQTQCFKHRPKRNGDTVASSAKGFGSEIPPFRLLVEIYFDQKGFGGQTDAFYRYYEQACWKSPRGIPYRNWKVLAISWIDEYCRERELQRRLALNRKVINQL